MSSQSSLFGRVISKNEPSIFGRVLGPNEGMFSLATQGPEWDALTAAQQKERKGIICDLELMREKLKIK